MEITCRKKLIDSISDVDQRIFIKFCTLLGYSAKVTEKHLKDAIGEKAYSMKSIEQWQTRFSNGNTAVEDISSYNIYKNVPIKISNNTTKEQNKFLNNFFYNDILNGGDINFGRGLSKMISTDYIKKNYNTILNKSLNHDKWLINENSFELILIHSYQSESSEYFWRYVLDEIYRKIDDKINIHNICWKFLFLLHWFLRNGHSNVIIDSYRQRPLLVELANIKKCSTSQCCIFSQLNPLYLALLLQKIEFHIEHKNIPGNLIINDQLLEKIHSNDDMNDICDELSDYIDKILNLQIAILNIRGLTSMDPYHKCILNPLKLCIIECDQIYNIIFKLLVKLHSALSKNDLTRHPNRFVNQFKQIKLFYRKCQGFSHLTECIQIPELTEEPPDFTEIANSKMNNTINDKHLEDTFSSTYY